MINGIIYIIVNSENSLQNTIKNILKEIILIMKVFIIFSVLKPLANIDIDMETDNTEIS
jgi:hypothetical protein